MQGLRRIPPKRERWDYFVVLDLASEDEAECTGEPFRVFLARPVRSNTVVNLPFGRACSRPRWRPVSRFRDLGTAGRP